MSQVINTNIASLNAQRNLNSSQSQLNVSLERLSSGLRINSAKDDAAGLAISERFTAQINGNNQAVRNANDGISYAQTAEGALEEIGNIGQRIRELAVQSANDTNSSADRQALNQEVEQLIAEAGRIADSTQFNDQNVLDGSLRELLFQVGANQGQTIGVSGIDARADQLGARVAEGAGIDLTDAFDNFGDDDNQEFNVDDISIGGVDIALSEFDDDADLDDVVAAINAVSGETGVEAGRAREVEATLQSVSAEAAGESVIFELNGNRIELDGETDDADGATEIARQINNANIRGVTAEVNDSDEVVITGSGVDLEFVALDEGDIDLAFDELDDNIATDSAGGLARGIELFGEVGQTISVDGDGNEDLGLDGDITQEDETLNDVSVATRDNASDTIRTMDFVLGQVNSLRAELGATQNRFESTVANLSVTSENLEASRSRILDADFAAETASLTRGQILQQAGTSVLAQANQIPNNVLGLLQ